MDEPPQEGAPRAARSAGTIRAAKDRLAGFVHAAAEGDRVLLGGLVLALALRLLLVPFFSDPLNFYGFRLTASFAEDGQNPWVAIASDPAVALFNPWGYPPAYLLPVLSSSALSLGNGYLFGLLIRVPLVLASLATAVILFRTARELGLDLQRARALALGYVFCPFTLLVDTIWGANDPLAILFAAGGVYYAVRQKPRFELAALLFGLGIAFKVYPLVLVPLLAALVPTWRERAHLVLLAALPGALTAGPVLLVSPLEFLRTLGLFVVGAGNESATLSLPWLLHSAAGVNDPLLGQGLIVTYLGALVVLAIFVRRKKLSFLHASTAAILALFLVAPRINHNYFLWALPFIMTAAAIGLWPKVVRLAATLSWVPLGILALIYNGASGVTGLFYWLLVAGAPRGQPYKLAPSWTEPVLVASFLAMLAVSLFALLRRANRVGSPAPIPRMRVLLRVAPLALERRGPIAAAALAACLLMAAAVASIGAPVLPEDFGSYTTRDHRVTVTDEFRSGLVGFTYSFAGSGFFDLNETGTGSFVIDTGGAQGNAYLTRLLPNKSVEVSLRFTLERLDGARGLLMVARIPSGWLGVEIMGGAIHLVYLDDPRSILQDFGPVGLWEPLDIELTLAPSQTEIRFRGLTAYGSGAPVDKIRLGHYDVLPYGGGRLSFDRLVLAWDAEPRGESPPLVAAMIVGTAAALAAPVWHWRRQRR